MKIQSTKDLNKKDTAHIAVYGESKSGKTRLIGTMPGTTLILNADKGLLALKGSDNIDMVTVNNFEDVIEFMQHIKSKDMKHDNVVIDSMSVISDVLLQSLEKQGVGGFDKWDQYEKYIRGIITTLRDSDRFNSLSIYELVEKENENGLLVKKVGLKGLLACRVGHFYDFFFASRKRQTKEGLVFKLQTQSKDGYNCGSRLDGLETFIEPDLNKLFNLIKA